jgi:hypothetical protein
VPKCSSWHASARPSVPSATGNAREKNEEFQKCSKLCGGKSEEDSDETFSEIKIYPSFDGTATLADSPFWAIRTIAYDNRQDCVIGFLVRSATDSHHVSPVSIARF